MAIGLPQNLKGTILSFFIGLLLVCNQFGGYIGKKFNIGVLNETWQVNSITNALDLKRIIILSLALILLHYITFSGKTVFRGSFFKGLLSGFFLFPVTVIAACILYSALWILGKIFQVLGIILSYVVIPFAWLYTHLIFPIFKFIAIPFVWIYKAIILPIVSWIIKPFGWLFNWLWESILLPLLPFFKPILIIVTAVVFGLFVCLPFILIGEVFQKIFRDTFIKLPSPGNIFCYGVGLGFFYFEMFCNYYLFTHGISNLHYSISALLPILFGFVFLLRYWLITEVEDLTPLTYRDSIIHYWKTSKMEFAVQFCLLPIGIAFSYFYGNSED